MLNSREAHWTLGYEIWKRSKLIGIGINSHVYYMSHSDLVYAKAADIFMVNFAIHNIHFIVLAETGLIGAMVWIYFLISKFKELSSIEKNSGKGLEIFKMTFFAVLICMIITGFIDISPLASGTIPLILFFGYFANENMADVKSGSTVV